MGLDGFWSGHVPDRDVYANTMGSCSWQSKDYKQVGERKGGREVCSMDTSHYLFLNQSQNRLVNLHRPLDVTVIVVVVVVVVVVVAPLAWASALDIATTQQQHQHHRRHHHHPHPHPCRPQSSRGSTQAERNGKL